MKSHVLAALVIAAQVLPAFAGFAKESVPPKPKLDIVVVENLDSAGGADSEFARLGVAFDQMARERRWPVEIAMHRFAANNPSFARELRIYTQPVDREVPGEDRFRAWVLLIVDGKKQDLGIVSHRFYPRPGRDAEAETERYYRGAARAIGARIEPILFPLIDAAAAR